jgi:hypothetical protein
LRTATQTRKSVNKQLGLGWYYVWL